MLARIRVLLLAFALTASALVFTSLPAGAVVTGPCKADATADGTPIDLTTATVWHMSKNATVSGEGSSDPELTEVSVAVSVLGVSYPVFSQSGKGHGGSAGPFHASDYSSKARVIGASGEAGPCAGSVKIIFDDQSPAGTALGLAGLIALVVGLLGAVGAAFMRGCFGKVLAVILGLIAGVGAGLLAEEAGLLDPFNRLDLLVPLGGAVLGLILAYLIGSLRGPGTVAPPA